jgi:hypothetical protein
MEHQEGDMSCLQSPGYKRMILETALSSEKTNLGGKDKLQWLLQRFRRPEEQHASYLLLPSKLPPNLAT